MKFRQKPSNCDGRASDLNPSPLKFHRWFSRLNRSSFEMELEAPKVELELLPIEFETLGSQFEALGTESQTLGTESEALGS
jgi:hypothetical protein